MESLLNQQVSWNNLKIDDKKFLRQSGWNKSSWKRELENNLAPLDTNKSYIFLDIDGVVHPANQSGGIPSNSILLEKMDMIVKLAKSTNSKLVISSNWRMNKNLMKQIQDELLLYYYTDEIDMLNNNYHTNFNGLLTLPDMNQERSYHIIDYLKRHPKGKMVILDDTESHIIDELRGNFVHTNKDTGITQMDIKKAIKILNK